MNTVIIIATCENGHDELFTKSASRRTILEFQLVSREIKRYFTCETCGRNFARTKMGTIQDVKSGKYQVTELR